MENVFQKIRRVFGVKPSPKMVDKAVNLTKDFLTENPEVARKFLVSKNIEFIRARIGAPIISAYLGGSFNLTKVQESLARLKAIEDGSVSAKALYSCPTSAAANNFMTVVREFKANTTVQNLAIRKLKKKPLYGIEEIRIVFASLEESAKAVGCEKVEDPSSKSSSKDQDFTFPFSTTNLTEITRIMTVPERTQALLIYTWKRVIKTEEVTTSRLIAKTQQLASKKSITLSQVVGRQIRNLENLGVIELIQVGSRRTRARLLFDPPLRSKKSTIPDILPEEPSVQDTIPKKASPTVPKQDRKLTIVIDDIQNRVNNIRKELGQLEQLVAEYICIDKTKICRHCGQDFYTLNSSERYCEHCKAGKRT